MLSAVPYHLAMRDLLQKIDPKVWDWFGQRKNDPQTAEALRFELLKTTYRLSRESHPNLYAAADKAAEALNTTLPVTLYQSQAESLPNAALAFAADELHIVLMGKVDESLSSDELEALMGHEIGHHVLNQMDDGDHWRAWDILRASVLDSQAHPAFLNSFRKWCLYGEIFCDRAALHVVDDPSVVVSMLVKVTMGATSVAPSEFMQQTQEVLNRLEAEKKLGSDGLTHPETYIRAFAIDRFANHGESASDPIAKLIEGPLDMSTLDLLQQQFISHATRQLLHRIFKLKAMRSELMLSHARLYFEDFSPSEIDTDSPCLELTSLMEDHQKKEAVSSYFAYVLLDFATADRSLDEFPLANSMQVAEELGIKDVFITIARKELKLRKNQIDQCDRDKEEMLQNAESTQSQP